VLPTWVSQTVTVQKCSSTIGQHILWFRITVPSSGDCDVWLGPKCEGRRGVCSTSLKFRTPKCIESNHDAQIRMRMEAGFQVFTFPTEIQRKLQALNSPTGFLKENCVKYIWHRPVFSWKPNPWETLAVNRRCHFRNERNPTLIGTAAWTLSCQVLANCPGWDTNAKLSFSSLAIRSPPQVGLSCAIPRINSRRFFGSRGRHNPASSRTRPVSSKRKADCNLDLSRWVRSRNLTESGGRPVRNRWRLKIHVVKQIECLKPESVIGNRLVMPLSTFQNCGPKRRCVLNSPECWWPAD